LGVAQRTSMETNAVILGMITEIREMNKTTNVLLSLIEGLTKQVNEQKVLIDKQKEALDGLYAIHNQEALKRLMATQ